MYIVKICMHACGVKTMSNVNMNTRETKEMDQWDSREKGKVLHGNREESNLKITIQIPHFSKSGQKDLKPWTPKAWSV